ncbi:hypothetical protein AVEN_174751-1 [Araneus ventricosus]|uniref:TPPP family protein CG45057 n=1 Tax=Araneus ventricosus TaxID=182803 RepID=A0A4Y2BKK6_ARAVE|nr:hypothetical protein AVEN_174751-1 [Araneus ventricosus]
MASFDRGNLHTMFDLFCSGKEKDEGKLSVRRIKVWLECAGIFGAETGVTESDVDDVLSNVAKQKISLKYSEFLECVALLAKEKQMDLSSLIEKLSNTTPPPKQINKSNYKEKDG